MAASRDLNASVEVDITTSDGNCQLVPNPNSSREETVIEGTEASSCNTELRLQPCPLVHLAYTG